MENQLSSISAVATFNYMTQCAKAEEKYRVYRLLCFVIALTLTAQASAQKLTHAERKARLDSFLTARYFKSPYDTNYVIRPLGKLTLKLRFNQTGNTFYAKGTVNNVYSEADLETSHKTTVSIGASYRGISAALAINPGKLTGAYKDYEFNLNYYSSRLSLDFSYQRSETLAGDFTGDEGDSYLQEGEASLKILNIAAFYTFNHRRFSYPAAFTQSYIQRRSAGSWLAGISYQGGTIKTTDALKERVPDSKDVRIYVGHVGIGGGYAYNLVLARKWLLHLSLMPTVVVYNRNNMTIDDVRQDAAHIRLNMIFNERAAVVYNISPRLFAGITAVMNNSLFKDDAITVNQNKWRARAFLGFRL